VDKPKHRFGDNNITANKIARQHFHISQGLCRDCRSAAAPGRRQCEYHLAQARKFIATYRKKEASRG
jgi:hypothetical protein